MTLEERLAEIKEHPELHHHDDLSELARCSMHENVITLMLFAAHERYAPLGYNGGRRCDVRRGPCSCGAWH